MALGAVSASPLEVAAVFGTLASGGVAHAPHAIVRVLGPDGLELPERFTPGERVVLSRETAYEMTSMLRGVIDHGTGAGAHAWGLAGALAGKTGTSDDRRDAWFAGYSSDRVTVVWVGYDDNRPTRLSGASGALPTWAEFMSSVRPKGGYAPFDCPSSMVTVTVDPSTGLLAGPDCPMRVTVELPDYRVPYWQCTHEAPWDPGEPYDDSLEPDGEAAEDTTGVYAARI
jgi:penicillin-binding protein 1B